MRVLQFYKTFFPDTRGGIEEVIHQIARGGVKLGLDMDVLSLTRARDPGILDAGGYAVHRARLDFEIASTGFSASAFAHFARLAARADIVHYHFPWPFMDLVHFAARTGKPSVVTYHSDIIRQERLLKLYRPLMNRFLASVDHVVATSPNYLATSDVLTGLRDKVSVIPIGLDRQTYPVPAADRLAHWRDRLGERFFLFVGTFRYYKGLHILLDAARETGFPIAIVGAGPIEAELKAQARRLGLTGIHFLGYLRDADKAALLTLCCGVVFPSHLRAEAFGVTLLEGAMHGKPLISSEIGTGTSYVNIHAETGLVVPPADPPALRDAMAYLWTHPEDAAKMGERARRRYERYFTADGMTRAYERLYRDVGGARKRPRRGESGT